MTVRTLISFFVLSILTSTFTYAQPGGRGKLTVGSTAPGLNVSKWVKGEFKPSDSEVYVLEFWATWCPPCRKSIPHLTKLQEEYEMDGLKVVGISTDSDPDLVAPFVKRQGLKMNYIVGIDNRRRTQRAWMTAAGLKGIPAVFIVNKNGIIQFIGNPHDEQFEIVLEKVMKGRYDQKKTELAKESIKSAKHFRSLNSWADASAAYKNAIAIDPIVFAELYIDLFEMLLVEKKDIAAAYQLAGKIITERGPEDPELLTWLAKKISLDDRITGTARRMDVAMKAATTALSFAKRKTDPTYISTVAYVYFYDDKIDEAIEWQRKAYFSAREKEKPSYKFTLDSYRSQKQHAEAGN
ncbi:MAG: TlpA disulfide reductase family protein [Phycisphaerales bacterium]|nr:TlpA disulfide reductase family protein [Phycisphaerales bacterium]